MYRLSVITLIAATTLFTGGVSYGQAGATGKATAEIIEIVSLSAQTNTDFTIAHSNNLTLGEFTVNKEAGNLTCEMVVEINQLQSIDRKGFSIKPSVSLSDDNNTRILYGRCFADKSHKGGHYQGEYSVVMAYN